MDYDRGQCNNMAIPHLSFLSEKQINTPKNILDNVFLFI